MNAKYVVIDHGGLMGETVYIFPQTITHRAVAETLSEGDLSSGGDLFRIVSAGFVTLRDNEFYAHGESVSLGLQARPEEDGKLINEMFRRDG